MITKPSEIEGRRRSASVSFQLNDVNNLESSLDGFAAATSIA